MIRYSLLPAYASTEVAMCTECEDMRLSLRVCKTQLTKCLQVYLDNHDSAFCSQLHLGHFRTIQTHGACGHPVSMLRGIVGESRAAKCSQQFQRCLLVAGLLMIAETVVVEVVVVLVAVVAKREGVQIRDNNLT